MRLNQVSQHLVKVISLYFPSKGPSDASRKEITSFPKSQSEFLNCNLLELCPSADFSKVQEKKAKFNTQTKSEEQASAQALKLAACTQKPWLLKQREKKVVNTTLEIFVMYILHAMPVVQWFHEEIKYKQTSNTL